MNKIVKTLMAGSILALSLGSAVAADEDADLVVNGDTPITVRTKAPDWHPLDELLSGWVFRASETQALQADDFENPGMPFVDQAAEAWATADGSAGKACADCHNDVESMKGVRAVMPKFNDEKGTMYTLAMYINNCRTERMGAEAWGYTSGTMASMEALIGLQSRGMPMNVAIDGPAKPYWEQGQELYYTRTGQLELSCASCHEENYGNRIRSDHLSQGQINGFPVYRLKNAKLNTIHARFKGCVRDTRAETFKPGGDEFIALEVYVASRANGLSVEGPSVRN